MKGVMLTAYGTPESLDEVEEYYTHIRGGRKPSESELADLISRYRAIGGTSPLLRITNQQVEALARVIERSGSETKVYAAMKHSRPFISEVVERAKGDGVDELLSIAMAPHYSHISVGSYIRTVEEANSRLGGSISLDFVRSWHDHPGLLSAWENRVRRAEGRAGGGRWLVFSAHSLPERIISQGDPYRDQLLETSGLIGEKLHTRRWSFSFQSASQTQEPWLGPDILEHLESLWASGERSFILAPVGFVSDHLEILYDLDVECVSWAEKRGAELVRCESLNDSDDLINCLFTLVQAKGFL